MVAPKYGPEISHDDKNQRHGAAVFARRLAEKQKFLQDLQEARMQYEKILLKEVRKAVGPMWYQALSETQRTALRGLGVAIYQDLLEGRPLRTSVIMKHLGLFPRPNTVDLMNCVYLGRDDPKELLAQLFLMSYGHAIDVKRIKYCLKARLILSGIYYLGMDNLIDQLREKFQPVPKEKVPATKPKPKIKEILESPYLQKMVAACYEKPVRKPRLPPPLPPFDDTVDAETEQQQILIKPLPLPPPPPKAPKKRLPRSFCDKIAGVSVIEPHSSVQTVVPKVTARASVSRKIRGSKLCLFEDKAFGAGRSSRKKGFGKPSAPSTGLKNSQYVINGVFTLRGKTAYLLSSICMLPAKGEIIHGGYVCVESQYINMNCGIRARPPPPLPDPCDCVKVWEETVFEYLKNSKCYCGHFYDFRNEGTFAPEELPYFQKPTTHLPLQFNYQTIYNLDEKHLHVEKDFKRIWETDSILNDGAKITKRRKKKSSTTCLGENPRPEDYLRCALRQMRAFNVAACLPDIHLAPELKEWMRYRMYGPFTRHQKGKMLSKSFSYWEMFKSRGSRGYGHVYPPKTMKYTGHTTWTFKMELLERFRKVTHRYKLQLFDSQAQLTNLLWPTMYQAELPDKKFREIFFSYLFARIEDMQIMNPYIAREAVDRYNVMYKKRYRCPPVGAGVR